ncbi:hypothetical protein AVU38_gp185 [Ralstonia phage RSL2]|uniref:Virion structural protein n=1 Tax=Ralstonia phage RSL2 TaxID=1585840 RepID=A0A0A8J9H9_9CAUD|nr:hypothetical protein AVU38_gp185 [Ralstonia phage RSL2]BAQ02713.1 hypothetical protein [Ralstonia phage RSL2]
MLAAGKSKQIYSDSGPGPQTLAGGDSTVGYFGQVSNTDLFSAADIVAQIPELAAATISNDNTPWLKFLYYGKYLFIKKYPIFYASASGSITSWAGLYAAGMLAGVDSVGAPGVAYPTWQLRFLNKGPYKFKIRTVTGDANPTPTQTVGTSTDTTPRRSSMFTELLYRCCNISFSLYTEQKFEQFLSSDMLGTSAIGEVNRENLVNTTYPNGAPLFHYNTTVSTTGISGYVLGARSPIYSALYRPVLELVPANQLFTIRPSTVSVNNAPPLVASATQAAVATLSTSLKRLSAIVPSTVIVTKTSNPTPTVNTPISRLQTIVPVDVALKRSANVGYTFNP